MRLFTKLVVGRRALIGTSWTLPLPRRQSPHSFYLCQRCTLSSSVPRANYLKEDYLCDEGWARRLQSPILQKVKPDDLFFEMDQKYQADRVLSAVDVDVYMITMSDPDSLDDAEELIYRLRKSPATTDTLPSTGEALVRAFVQAKRLDDILRILNDRFNYGVFLDFHLANVLMNEFLTKGDNEGAMKVASFLMLEEDFGPPTSRLFALVSCLKCLGQEGRSKDISNEPQEGEVEEEEEKRVRHRFVRNVYYDQHFDLHELDHILGKTLAKVGEEVGKDGGDEVLGRSAQIAGWALFGKWEKVGELMDGCIKNKGLPVYPEVVKLVTELIDKAQAAIEASPTKTLPKPVIHQFPGMNVEEKDTKIFWARINYPAYEKIIPVVKTKLSSLPILQTQEEATMLKKAEEMLISAVAKNHESEVSQQLQKFEEWENLRKAELEKQLARFRAYQVSQEIEATKKDLKEKEEVIFFFDHEEEWMMKLPPSEQAGYKLSSEYVPKRISHPFVRCVPPKKDRKKKSKV